MTSKTTSLRSLLGKIVLSLGLFWLCSGVAQALSVPLWGQSYSPNVGWINFYCAGGSTRPAQVVDGTGAPAMSIFCNPSVSYGVTYDLATRTFTGYAYSSNAGWLNMSGITLDAANKLLGSTNFGNFGTTSYQASQPNANNPGGGYTPVSGDFTGYAYSDKLGYFAWQTGSTNPYANQVYGVYMDTTAPVLVTSPSIFAADAAKTLSLNFVDIQSGIKSIVARITQPGGAALVPPTGGNSVTTTSNTGTYTFTHNFGEAKPYQLEYTVCNNFDVCETKTIDNFFHVVAATPLFDAASCAGTNYAVSCPSAVTFSTGVRVSDNSEYHSVTLQLSDRFGNRVVSEAGIKQVKTRFNFNNTTKLDQVALTGDAVRFVASEFALDKNPAGTTTDWLTEADSVYPFPAPQDGNYLVQVFAYAPTSSGYEPIAADGFLIQLANIDYEVTDTGCRESVGETAEGGICPAAALTCTLTVSDPSAGLVDICIVQ